MNSRLTNLTIPVKHTKSWLKEWQKTNTNCAKAFLIPVSDLVDAFIEMGVVTDNKGVLTINSMVGKGVRAYVGINPDTTKRGMGDGYGNGLFIVGTEKVGGVHKDIVEGNKGVDLSKMNGTGIYDFITPCPADCDPGSPLIG